MAYRDPTFNVNVLTDLLGTYLTHKSDEREKYYKAAEKASKTVIRQGADGYLYYLPESGEAGNRALPNVAKNEKKISSTIEEFFDKDNKSVLIKNVNGIRTGLDGNPIKSSDLKGLSKTKKQIVKKGQTSENYDAINAIVTDEIRELRSTQRSRRNIYGDELKATWNEEIDRPKINYFLSIRQNLQDWIKENPGKQPIYKEGIGVYKPSKKKDKKVEVKNEPGSFWK